MKDTVHSPEDSKATTDIRKHQNHYQQNVSKTDGHLRMRNMDPY